MASAADRSGKLYGDADSFCIIHISIIYRYSYTLKRRNGVNRNTSLYLRDGEIPICGKDECYKRGCECHHTTDVTHALNPEPRKLVPDEQGNLWEESPEI